MGRLTLSFAAAAVAAAVMASSAAASLPRSPQQVTGVIGSSGSFSLTITTPGKPVGVVSALTAAANRIQSEDYPYVWGGGHGEAGVASVGISGGPGYNGKRRGYDCSGSVAAVLTAGGLWPVGASVPADNGVIAYLRRTGVIAPGAGTGAEQVTLYDDPGVHIFMNIDGRFFGTSDGGGGSDSKGGPGWLAVGGDVTSSSFKRYHVVPRVLAAETTAGSTIGFELGAGLGLLEYPVGTDVTVTYRTTASGMLVAQDITPVGEIDATGTVQSIGPNGSTLTITTSTGITTTLDVAAGGAIAQELAGGQVVPGDGVVVGYVGTPPATSNLLSLTITSTPSTTTTPTTTTTTPTTTTPATTTPSPTTPTGTTPTTPTGTTPTTTTAPGSGQPGYGSQSGYGAQPGSGQP